MISLLDHTESRPLGVFELAKRCKLPMIMTLLAGLSLTVLYLATATREFQSDAKLFVRIGRESVALDPTATTGQFVPLADTRGSEMYAVEELLKSRVLAEKIVDELGIYTILEKDPGYVPLGQRLSWLDGLNVNPLRVYSMRDKALEVFERNLRVSSGSKTSVIALSYKCEDPKLAQRVLDSLLRFANGEHLRIHKTRGSQEFFVSQSKLLEGDLVRLENRLRDLKNETRISSLASQREIQLKLIGELEGDLISARTEQEAVQAEIQCRREQLKDVPGLRVAEQTTGQPQSTDQALREKLYDLEIREQELAAQYAVEHPLRVELRAQIDGVRTIFRDAKAPVEVKLGINQAHQTAELAINEREAQLVAATARARSLDTKIAGLEQEMKRLNDTEVTVNGLEREIDLARANWRSYAEHLEEARITQQLEEANISSLNVMQPPTYSDTPVSPKPIATLAVGFVGAVMASFGVALLAFRRHDLPPPAPSENGSSTATSLATMVAQRSKVAAAKL